MAADAVLLLAFGGPTRPEKEAEKLTLHPDFNINLVASEPLIEKAMSLDWDPQGHLWVAETPEYPNGRNVNKNDEMVELWSQKDPEKVKVTGKEDRLVRLAQMRQAAIRDAAAAMANEGSGLNRTYLPESLTARGYDDGTLQVGQARPAVT